MSGVGRMGLAAMRVHLKRFQNSSWKFFFPRPLGGEGGPQAEGAPRSAGGGGEGGRIVHSLSGTVLGLS